MKQDCFTYSLGEPFKDLTDELTVEVASNTREIKALLEVGFEYICEKDDLYYFRKRK